MGNRVGLHRVLRAGLACLLAVLLVVGIPGIAVAAPRAIGGRPANPDPAVPRSQSIFLYVLDKGNSRADAVIVSNETDQHKTIKLHSTDGLATNDGSFSCKQNVEQRTDVGSWITLDKDEVSLGPGERETVGFTISMPQDASVGEHNGCITMQAEEGNVQREGHVVVRFRSAIRVAVTVPGDVYKKLSIEHFSVTATRTNHKYDLTLASSGNVSVDADTKIKLVGLFGKTWYENGGTYPVLPGHNLKLHFENGKLPFWGGWYWAEASAGYNSSPYVSGVNHDADDFVILHAKHHLVFVWPHPWACVIMVTILLLIIGIILFAWRRKKRQDAIKKTWEVYTVKARDTIQSVAKKHNIRWRMVASVNKLKPPYELTKGQKLYVPKADKTK